MKKLFIMVVAMIAIVSCGSRTSKVQDADMAADSVVTEVADSTVTAVDTLVAE